MSSSTALLPKDRKKTDHVRTLDISLDLTNNRKPIFLRVTHSPWVIIDQKTLLSLRFAVSVFLTSSLILIVNYDVQENQLGWLTVFSFSNIAYFLQALYSWIAFVSALSATFQSLLLLHIFLQ
jgi:hypothetical protein